MDKNKKKGFSNPTLPGEHEKKLSPFEKELLKKKFISGAPGAADEGQPSIEERDTTRVTLTMRVPRYFADDLNHIAKLSGQTKNATYIEILRVAIKVKLKELQEK